MIEIRNVKVAAIRPGGDFVRRRVPGQSQLFWVDPRIFRGRKIDESEPAVRPSVSGVTTERLVPDSERKLGQNFLQNIAGCSRSVTFTVLQSCVLRRSLPFIS